MKYMTKQCTSCGGEVVMKNVEEILSGGGDTAVVTVEAGVCLHCGERFYDVATVRRFEEIRHKLECHETDQFKAVGRVYQVA